MTLYWAEAPQKGEKKLYRRQWLVPCAQFTDGPCLPNP